MPAWTVPAAVDGAHGQRRRGARGRGRAAGRGDVAGRYAGWAAVERCRRNRPAERQECGQRGRGRARSTGHGRLHRAGTVGPGSASGLDGSCPLRLRCAAGFRSSRVPSPDRRHDASRLLLHEAEVHAIPGRELRDLGDALLLHDPIDPEPFWNRLEAIRWPADRPPSIGASAEIGVLFASLGRQPHIWPSPPHDEPADLVARLAANGFEDVGGGLLMVARDVDPRPSARSPRGRSAAGRDARAAARLAWRRGRGCRRGDRRRARWTPSASGDGPPRRVVGRDDGLARRHAVHPLPRRASTATRPRSPGGRRSMALSYLSSIGTVSWARGRGLGRLVTATATVDASRPAASGPTSGVFADNAGARSPVRGLGFVGAASPGLTCS